MERFWSKVDKNGENGCWNWTACSSESGYGFFRDNGKNLYAHRISLELKLGRPIADGLCANHNCKQNRKCVNPDHLYEGTYKQNTNDRNKDETMNRGEEHGKSKLTADDVREIRVLIGFGFSQRELGQMYGVYQSTISQVILGKKWKHI